MIAILGGEDFAVGNPANECIEMLKKKTKSRNFKGIVIPNAAHSYLGYEDRLSKEIVDWLEKLNYRGNY